MDNASKTPKGNAIGSQNPLTILSFVIEPSTRTLLEHLSDQLDTFLTAWAKYMTTSGYIAFTTARRSDCTVSLQLFSDSLLAVLGKNNEFPTFAELIQRPQWAHDLLAMARRHRVRGVTTSMFIGCFKTFLHAIEDMLLQFEGADVYKNEALICIRRLGDAYETLLVEDWAHVSKQEALNILDDTNRQLSLEKCKYENILSSISDLVFIVNAQGKIMEVNHSVNNYLNHQDSVGRYVWEFFPLSASDISDMISGYLRKSSHCLSDLKNARHFDVTLVALQDISLASNAYLMVFSDVSTHAQQKALLEGIVEKRTCELVREKLQLEEMNITLKNVLNSIEKQKKESMSTRRHVLKEQVVPILHKLKTEKVKETRDVYLDALEKQLAHIYGDQSDEQENVVLVLNELTAVEIRICHMLRNGFSSKSIAQALNLSVETIHTHRKHIRRKLGLQGKNTSIFKYLNSNNLI